jgi:hypothetical protein
MVSMSVPDLCLLYSGNAMEGGGRRQGLCATPDHGGHAGLTPGNTGFGGSISFDLTQRPHHMHATYQSVAGVILLD